MNATVDERRREILAQPGAMKEVYGAGQDTVNPHTIVRGPDCWHLFYGPWPGRQNLEKRHATSDDLVVWTRQAPVLLPGGPGDCDHAEVSEASVIEHEGRWYMIYACQPRPEASRRFSLAVSDDLWHWEKVPGDGSPVFIPLPEWSGWTEDGVLECKDPWLIRYEDRFLMYFVSQNRWGDSCLALAESEDLVHWEDRGPLMTFQRIENKLQGPSGFEVPRVFERDGRYYIFVMNFWGTQYASGDDPLPLWRVGRCWVRGTDPACSATSRIGGSSRTALRPFGQPSTRLASANRTAAGAFAYRRDCVERGGAGAGGFAERPWGQLRCSHLMETFE